MLMRYTRRWTCCLMAAAVMFALSGCERQESAPPAPEKPEVTPEKPAEPAAAAPSEDSPEPEPKAPAEGDIALDPLAKLKALPLLAAADKLDGKEDKIIARCASCSLGMDGKEEHSLEFMNYTFYFCTADCKKQFGEDPLKAVLALKIPEG